MARTPKNPNVERVAQLPFDKSEALPIPTGSAKARRAGASTRSSAGEAPPAATARRRPPAKEEYPGPQTASSGDHVDPGNVRPFRRRGE